MKDSFKLIGITTLTSLSFFLSCRTDNKDSVAPQVTTCDTANVTFATVKPIFVAKCTLCHAELGAEPSAKSWSNFGAIVGAIKHESAYMAMPKNGAKLSDCEIRKIESWYNHNK